MVFLSLAAMKPWTVTSKNVSQNKSFLSLMGFSQLFATMMKTSTTTITEALWGIFERLW
jgi:hypothetical protein